MITLLAIAFPIALGMLLTLCMSRIGRRADERRYARDEHAETLGVGGEAFTINHVAEQ